MKNRIYNFAAGPSMLTDEVLLEIEKNLLNYQNSGLSVMEMSHRSKDYLKIFNRTKQLLKELLHVDDDYEILFIQGGATEQFSAIAANFLKGGKADYILTGNFSKKAAQEAMKYGTVNIVYDGKQDNCAYLPKQEDLVFSDDARYVHYCANNTIYGTEWSYIPETNAPLICDMSSNILSKPIDIHKYSLIYAGAQKNMGIAGMAVIIIKKDLIKETHQHLPVLMDYATQLKADSMYNTPPTFTIYVCGLVAEWLLKQGGLEVMAKRNQEKAAILYNVFDNCAFYKGYAAKDSRSLMNVTFTTTNDELDALFVEQAKQRGLLNLKGHRALGGIRASIYNAMPLAGVQKLADFMEEFAKENSK